MAEAVDGAHRPALQQVFTPRADGSFTIRPKLKAGDYWIRVESIADARHLAGASPRRRLNV